MGKRNKGGIEAITSMPWQVGIIFGLVAFMAIRYGIGWYFSSQGGPVLAAMGKAASEGIYAPFAWLVLGASWIGAGVSYLGRRRRRLLLETQTGLDSIRSLNWKEFELLIGEAFRRQGYSVEETGLGGKDGGIDLVLRKEGKRILVQCKQWRTRQVTVNVVREMYGLLAHHGADEVKIVALGSYTNDAARFAAGKPIELVHGEALLLMVRSVQRGPSPTQPILSSQTNTTPLCPKCGLAMIRRENRKTHEFFWGCSGYPRCRGMRSMEMSGPNNHSYVSDA
ncbi:restriction endonuclease [Dyella sp. GSA-30]|uniref:restriction endonuclease n=1 Tax=Dyella sp. GSA-30 TaxID=2994496 RepID=UPI0024906E98|nr:restriction endonuclease [Dyella sp. GSA-30]BDU22461.1 membrane protein [Dyella sp. GSA-30]